MSDYDVSDSLSAECAKLMLENSQLRANSDKEKLASWMIINGFATGHGDTFDDLLKELTWQVIEIRDERARP